MVYWKVAHSPSSQQSLSTTHWTSHTALPISPTSSCISLRTCQTLANTKMWIMCHIYFLLVFFGYKWMIIQQPTRRGSRIFFCFFFYPSPPSLPYWQTLIFKWQQNKKYTNNFASFLREVEKSLYVCTYFVFYERSQWHTLIQP